MGRWLKHMKLLEPKTGDDFQDRVAVPIASEAIMCAREASDVSEER